MDLMSLVMNTPSMVLNPAVAAGAAFFAVRWTVNGMCKRMYRIEKKIDGFADRLARIEGRLEL